MTVLINSAYLDSNEKVTMRLIEEGKTIDNIMKVLIVSYLIMIAAVGFIGVLFRYQQKILTELNESKQEILKINKSLEMLSVLNENIWKKSPVGILVYNSDGICINANEASEKMLEMTEIEIKKVKYFYIQIEDKLLNFIILKKINENT